MYIPRFEPKTMYLQVLLDEQNENAHSFSVASSYLISFKS